MCGTGLAREPSDQEICKEARAKTLSYFSWICPFACLNSNPSVRSNVQYVLFRVYFMCFKCIRAWLQQGQLALSGPICTVPFHILECLLHRVNTEAAARQSMHTEGHPSQVADITIIISYSLELCRSPSATGALHSSMNMVTFLIRIRTCKSCQQKMLLLHLKVF